MNNLKQSAKARILTISSIVLLLICAVCTVVTSSINTKLEEALAMQSELYVQIAVHTGEYKYACDYLTAEARAYINTTDTTRYDNYYKELRTTKRKETAVEQLRLLALTEDEFLIVDQLVATADRMAAVEQEAFALFKEGKNSDAYTAIFKPEYKADIENISLISAQLDEAVRARLGSDITSLNHQSTNANIVTYIALAVTFAAQLILMGFVLIELIVPINKIQQKMTQFSEGDLHTPIDLAESNTEIGCTVKAINEFRRFQSEIIDDIDYLLVQMSQGNFDIKTKCEENYKGDYQNIIYSLRKINRRLSSALSDINIASLRVDSGAVQVSGASQCLSDGAVQQASSIEQLSANIERISYMITSNAKAASEASKGTEKAGEAIMAVNEKFDELVNAMNEIQASSDETKKIIKTIEDIAFRTNILALNAAVEAAKAGKAGKGFAVVADEVKNLAEKSSEAAKSTTGLIENTVEAVNRGNMLLSEAASQMDGVSRSAQSIADVNEKIADSAREAAEAVRQVTAGVELIADVVQTNSATAEETAAASVELSAQSETCKQLISQFNLRTDDIENEYLM
ncbi:MAG: hypothetical protein IJ446_01530 [Oscillospiraceae bacterium]|nr:hypothetical protein [Oscillospiraceae bacterium]